MKKGCGNRTTLSQKASNIKFWVEVLHSAPLISRLSYLFSSSTKPPRMKWVLSHQAGGHHRWVLHTDDGPVQFTYNFQYRSVRTKAKTARLFFLEEADGFFQKKVLLRSEYGVVLGEAQATHTTKDGILLFNNEKFFYRWNDGKLLLLNRHKTVVFQTQIELRQDAVRLERMAFVFCNAWLLSAEAGVKNTRPALTA